MTWRMRPSAYQNHSKWIIRDREFGYLSDWSEDQVIAQWTALAEAADFEEAIASGRYKIGGGAFIHCSSCGLMVGDYKVHDDWHRALLYS